jgi:hypothetical protein
MPGYPSGDEFGVTNYANSCIDSFNTLSIKFDCLLTNNNVMSAKQLCNKKH